VELHALHRVADQFGVAGTFLVGRNGADERLGLRREDLRRGAENLGGSLADEHVLGFHLEVAGNGFGELAGLAGVAARTRAALEQRAQRAEYLLTRAD